MTRRLLEICVDSADGLAAAVAGGADRIELCSALELGGLTPSPGLMALAAACGRPVQAMIRPRAGDFCFSARDVRQMHQEIAAVRAAGLAGVVLGASLDDGRLDGELLADLTQSAGGLSLTLHRAFDLVPDREQALELAVSLGFDRILTSGGETSALAGKARLRTLHQQAAGRIVIMPGAGVHAESVRPLLDGLDVREVHASCGVAMSPPVGLVRDLGFEPLYRRRTDEAAVRALRRSLDDLA